MSDHLFKRKGALKVAMVAGEASGDLLAAHLMDALRAHRSDIEFAGIGGPRMEARGFHSMVPQEKLAVRGYSEVIKSLPELLRIRRQLRDRLLAERPDVFIGVDAPDFNLALEGALKKGGIPTVHYVSPSVWAWRPERVQKIGKSVNHVLCLFPMEPPLYRQAGVPVTYVGHPLASEIPLDPDKDAMREQLGVPLQVPVFTLMPGSRKSELEYMVPVYLDTARLLLRQYPDAQFLVPLATRATLDLFEQMLYRYKARDLPIRKLFGHAQMATIASDVVLVTSGTATLEVALTKRPMVISYKLSAFTYRLVKRKIKLPYVGLPNILCGRFVVPELLQGQATPQKLAEEMQRLYTDSAARADMEKAFTELHLALRQDTATRAARAVLEVARCH
ncbi:lipid-A-disaccharide synthase [Chromobacterium subtsugae]|uniref:Lipid-A-disaccharide synthase n=2 Tax=Chromobacterium subtsugae TaxID=251747 RepID=A0ABS7FF53_9NEIS|nr:MULTISPECIES: lipid-A-disaccharide synthase [Chromobacterium]KUM01893.1 lipid-A-disaccharide synthase [Chromobacterium subtsugae]KZE88212.1 lipid-A-disaccharide synthase [Chromobacterium sp. F49]MBW7565607.1 lipid-A-disaccharide synthase [Chromobacterium subtsugae]MBW8287938.1 lipid-A-disaccharide synthase [Chromobacterium subtsugae]OBU86913.1 lipid-A-disaccharide synthase [Chromobacterium subtsugae]